MGGAVDDVGLPLVFPAAALEEALDVGVQRRGAVGHGAVHHLALSRRLRVAQRGQQAEGEVERAAAIVAHQVQWRHRPLGRADAVQGAGHRDVVDVVTGGLRPGAGLAPAGHAAVDERRVAGQGDVGPQAQPLHHARAEALDQAVRPLDQLQASLGRGGMLEVQRHRAAAAEGDVELAVARALAVDPHHVGAKVAEQHAAEGGRADAGELQDAEADEGTGSFAAHASFSRLTTTPAASRSQVSGVTPCARKSAFSTFWVGVLGRASTTLT